MAARLFCQALLQQVKRAQLLGPRHALTVTGLHRLHVKMYDKDLKREVVRVAEKNQGDTPFVATMRDNVDVKEFVSSAAAKTDEVDDEADTFGSGLALTTDQDDLVEEEYSQNPPNRKHRLRPIDYVRLIKGHLQEKRLQEAVAVLEQRMLQQDRVKPDTYIYNLLISACAKAGQTQKAFSLFTKMRQRGLRITGGTYTSLFNACANTPHAIDGLQRTNHLREIMLEKGVEPNVKHYHAMIKAYGRCGEVQSAFQLVDEMRDRQLPLSTATFNFLLQACASDAECGFRHGLLTWHKMLRVGLQPDYYSFKTMLRCTRDCSFGDLQVMHELLQQILQERNNTTLLGDEKTSVAPLQRIAAEQSDTATPTALQVNSESQQLEMPNLLAAKPHLGSLVSLSELQAVHERFLLLGGITGYLQLMKSYHITPDIELFTAMLEVVPPTYAAEKQIIGYIRRIGLKADIDFFNILIKKRSMRSDYEGAKEVLSMIRTAGLHPDIVTYGVLALGCQTAEQARELLQEMRNNQVRMNIQILGAMLRQGCAQKAFPYVSEILQLSLDERIRPNNIFLQHLHKFYNQCARAIDAQRPYTKSKRFRQAHGKFCAKLRLYYDEHGLTDLKLEDKIRKINAQQRHAPEVEGEEPLKNAELARKQKERKYIKKIKLPQLQDDVELHDQRLEAPQKIPT